MIDIKIFPVEHGFCAAIEISSIHTIMIDCGTGSQFQPSKYIAQRHCPYLDYLILPAYTEEHLSGFPELVNYSCHHNVPIHFFAFNPSINPTKLSDLQSFPVLLGNTLQDCKNHSQIIEFDDLILTFFWNSSPQLLSTKNSSLVTFISYRDINMILPSDLHEEGWQELLQLESFCQNLKQVNVFVAADHGVESGYCAEVFQYCHPEVIIISNKNNQPLDERMINKYSAHAQGDIRGISEKNLLTTYEEGTITVSKYLDSLRRIVTQRQTKKSVYAHH